jgi:hypothetical protein
MESEKEKPLANRWKKEEARKRREARRGLSTDEVKALDEKEDALEELWAETQNFHGELFPEEYDFMLDSIADARIRARGDNPMSSEYQDKVNQRRERLGFGPLGKDGMPTSNATIKFVGLFLYDGNQIPLANLIRSLGLGNTTAQENPND